MTTNSKVKFFDVETPREGFFEMREVSKGPLVAVRFWLEDGDREMCGACMGIGEGDGLYGQCEECGGTGNFLMSEQTWRCEVDGKTRDPWKAWLRASKHETDEVGYRYRLAKSAFDRDHRGVEPRKPIDINATKSVF